MMSMLGMTMIYFTIPINKFCDDFIKIGVVSESIEIKLISNKGYDVDIKGYEHF